MRDASGNLRGDVVLPQIIEREPRRGFVGDRAGDLGDLFQFAAARVSPSAVDQESPESLIVPQHNLRGMNQLHVITMVVDGARRQRLHICRIGMPTECFNGSRTDKRIVIFQHANQPRCISETIDFAPRSCEEYGYELRAGSSSRTAIELCRSPGIVLEHPNGLSNVLCEFGLGIPFNCIGSQDQHVHDWSHRSAAQPIPAVRDSALFRFLFDKYFTNSSSPAAIRFGGVGAA